MADGNLALLAVAISTRELSTASKVIVSGLPVPVSPYVPTPVPTSSHREKSIYFRLLQSDGARGFG